jgi:hypothetical protein
MDGMIQLLSNRPLPPSARGKRLTDPDLLLVIAERIRCGNAVGRAGADEFGLVLGDLRMGGTWKLTGQGRLTRALEAICSCLTPRAGGEISVLDLGASEGLTTLELARALRARFHGQIHVGLADLNLWLLRYRRGPVREYRASSGEPIMVKIGRFGLRLARKRHDQQQASDPLVALYLGCGALRREMQLDTRISLVHPLVQSDPSITVMELDCLVRDKGLKQKYDGIRASNVLNTGYFTRSQIDAALGNIHAYLVEGGCLVVSRNREETGTEAEDGSAWRKNGARFLHIADFGGGSEIRLYVDRWHAT